jgi:hypothetical protein
LFTDSNDERKYLLDEASKSLDSWLDAYQAQKASDWDDIKTTKGYQNFERQENTRKQYPLKAPKAGEDPFGFGNQVELYFGIDKNNADLSQSAKDYLNRGSIDPNAKRIPQIEALDWLTKNSGKYGWKNAGRTNLGDVQWWHWIYTGNTASATTPPPSAKTASGKTSYTILNRGQISALSDTALESRFQQNMLDTDNLNSDINSGKITEEFYQKTLLSLEEEKRLIETEKHNRLESKLS